MQTAVMMALISGRLLAASARWAPRALPLLASPVLARSFATDASAAGKPKRALSAYQFFLKEESPKVKASMPELKGLAISKEATARYQALKASEPASLNKYEADAAASKAAYAAAMAAWKATAPPAKL